MKAKAAISLALAALMSLCGREAAASGHYIGIYNSLKGFGIGTAVKSSDGSSISFVGSLTPDFPDIFTGEA